MVKIENESLVLILRARELLEKHAVGKLDDNGLVQEMYAIFAGVECRAILQRALFSFHNFAHVQIK